MVYFTEMIWSGCKYLSIAKDETTREEDVLQLLVLSPKIGLYAPSRTRLDVQRDNFRQWSKKISDGTPLVHQDTGCQTWLLQSPSHFYRVEPTPSPSLGRHIISETSHWRGTFRIRGEFTYIQKYWEWLEDATSRSKEILARARISDAIYCSRYTYDRNPDIMRAFCEAWCPEFNVLETSGGAVSISLWDIHNLGGLPICGDMYEETVPCLEELTGSYMNGRFLPRTCEYLFAAFYRLLSDKKTVHISSWIDFWFRGAKKYSRPPKRVVKKSTRPKSTHNPDVPIAAACSWSSENQSAFEELGIKSPLRLPTYLSAFIACWLCVFVFPHIDGFIRPETFKVACLMATGKCFNLAVPVLASLYRGLNDISRSTSAKVCFPAHYIYGWLAYYFITHYPVPKKVDGPLMTTYSGEGGAHYYDERTARRHVHDGGNIYWHANLFRKEGGFCTTDNSKLKGEDPSFLMSIRPCYLTLRCDDSFIAEPYNPSHFSRQFGFCQDVPCASRGGKRSLSLEEGFILWRHSTRSDTGSQLYVPVTPTKLCDHLTESYRQWWRTKHDNYLKREIETLIAKAHPPRSKGDTACDKPSQSKLLRIALKKRPPPPPEGSSTASDDDIHFKRRKDREHMPNDQDIPDISNAPLLVDKPTLPLEEVELESMGESSEHSLLSPLADAFLEPSRKKGPSTQNTLENEMSLLVLKKTAQLETSKDISSSIIGLVSTGPAVSSFCLDSVASRAYKRYASSIWEDIKERISRTSLSHAQTAAGEIDKALCLIDEREHIDLTHIRTLVGRYTKEVMDYSDVVVTVGGSMTVTNRDKEVALVRARLVEARETMETVIKNKTTLEKRLVDVDDDIAEIRKQLSERISAKNDLKALIAGSANEADEMDAEVVNLKEAMSTLKGAKVVSDADLQSLSEHRTLVEKAREDILQFQWAP